MKKQPQSHTATILHRSLYTSGTTHLLKFLLLLALLLLSYYGSSQVIGSYQTTNSGKWNNPETWLRWNGDSWENASEGPSQNDGPILIGKEHTVSITEGVVVDETTIEGVVIVEPDAFLRVSDGEGVPDLLLKGKIENMGIINGRTSTPGQMIVEDGGLLINQGSGRINTKYVQIAFAKGAAYQHDQNAGTIPDASWDEGSTCLVTGTTDNNPANSDQTFGNFIWNCSGMISNINIGGAGPMEVKGIFMVQNTGDNFGININQERLQVGEYRQSGGLLRLANSTDKNGLVVQNNFIMDGGTLLLATNQATGILSLNGHFNHSGGAIAQSGSNATGTIEFAGDGENIIQNWIGGGTFEGTVNFNIASGAAVTFGAPEFIDLGTSKGTFINNGTLYGNFPEYDPEDGDLEGLILPGEGILRSNGTLAPGNSVGVLTIIGDLIIGGTLSVEIEGPGFTQYDRIIVTGQADISGATLEADFDTYVPMTDPEIYQIVAASSYAGGSPALFAGVSGTALNFTFTLVDHTDGGIRVESIVLPVELISFSAKRTGLNVELNWRTVQEINNDYIAVERADHSLQFEEIGRVAGAGTTTETQDYHFMDYSPMPGANYYRLRQVDMDGTTEYHEVIYVDFTDASQSHSLEVFPNPAPDRIRASWKKDTQENATLRVFSTSGQLLKNYTVSGDNATFELPLDGLAPGPYLLQLLRPSGNEVIRFVKQ